MNKRIVYIGIMLALIALAPTARADTILFNNPLQVDNLMDLVNKVLDFLFTLSIPFLTAIVLYGAFTMINSKGKAEEFKKGWLIILYAAIGFLVLLLSKGLGSLVADILNNAP